MRARAAVIVASLVVLALAGPVPASATTREDYASRVEQALAAVRDAGTAVRADEAADGVAAEVLGLLPPGERVEADGRDVAVDSAPVRAMAQRLADAGSAAGREEAAADLEAHLASIDAALGAPSGTVTHDPALLATLLQSQVVDTRIDLGEILRGYLDRLLLAFNDWWAGLAAGGPAGRVAQVVIVGALALALAVALWSVLRSLRRQVARRDAAAAAAEGVPVVAAAEGLPPDALGHAEGLAAEGRLREAVRALYGGAARTLVEAGLVAQTRTRTGAELLADVGRTAPDVRPPLRELTSAFELAWYGHVEPGEAGWSTARDAYGRTLGAARGVQAR